MARSACASVDGAFVLLDLPRRERLVYVEGPASGQIIVAADDVERCATAYDTILAQSLSLEESAELIRKMGDLYEHP